MKRIGFVITLLLIISYLFAATLSEDGKTKLVQKKIKSSKMVNYKFKDNYSKIELTAEVNKIEVKSIKITYEDKSTEYIRENFNIIAGTPRVIKLDKPIKSIFINCSIWDEYSHDYLVLYGIK